MRLHVHEIRLTDHDIWRSAREAIPVQPGVLVELTAGGRSGFGEASAFMTDRYNSSLDALHASLRSVAGVLRELPADDPEGAWSVLAPLLADSPFALAALDVAAHDLAARLADVPLWRRLGADEPEELHSSYSIGLDEPDVMVRKLLDRPGWSAYKVKLAAPGDLHILKALREHTDAPFFVDGNCGWEPDATAAALGAMAELGVTLLEQPFPRESWAAAKALKEMSPIPVYADESITGPHDLDACAQAFHGVNLKLMKAGGVTPALRMLRAARAAGLGTMLGCMPESSAGVSATAHLGPFVDHLDADSIALLAVDTGTGILLDGTGRITLPSAAGTGFVPEYRGPAFTVRPAAVGQAGWDGDELSVHRDGTALASVRIRRRPVPGRAPADTVRQLDVLPAPSADPATAEELAALVRGAVTRAVADGADTVWLRTGHDGIREACRATGFHALPGSAGHDGGSADDGDGPDGGSDLDGGRPGDGTLPDGHGPSSLMLWKADRPA
ncbi:L-alanine-DL-glutamate epimerase-like enolase superfamily enzyme [Streptomyces sp. PanSC19]|uniref:dipeptide epimerase n=1 Tax=Streptomyces sp. PanSC19 TaxID=1520455 RepID=UPI000F495A8C|nr:dipeptide epimerase [Streptomyces sp. PanSC19]ROQ24572.1 L-alanine-DL-glutamate epimerase-like enolase superfamily enzyme [Streptomyces sp. PanSC19]